MYYAAFGEINDDDDGGGDDDDAGDGDDVDDDVRDLSHTRIMFFYLTSPLG